MLPEQSLSFEAEIWLYPGEKASWHFITVPTEVSRQIRFFAGKTNGFGSIRVRAQIVATRWETSLFPDKASGCYFLPVKAMVRKAERITTGDWVSVELSIV
ncbi:MAG: DUF1905 domain-containing protein [Hoeflea sp.]|nr:DUF1905 domain-containing protein [Hoeflea sp.]MBU4529406.1 DUF1905 domain-containing protein [Alphaproteobacteria bacterium]MBU4546525.1 DUF1905 domain-containing protein [Alphaproteobacteria bacterium]MBU4550793.1 DUF1905 domain-containing protein [Alphaproteobacteria bacterium]MBV1723735.1 DUF1905 domain-containing protein [Hoeflea sp.]MBV1763012.1 DUF1905 domain-containing protein [Hoeflea sp.]